VLLKAEKKKKEKTVKVNVGMSNFFLKTYKNGIFVWLPNVEKVREAQIRGGMGHCWRLKTGVRGQKN